MSFGAVGEAASAGFATAAATTEDVVDVEQDVVDAEASAAVGAALLTVGVSSTGFLSES